jgi:uncharacterized protein (DUF58 family)
MPSGRGLVVFSAGIAMWAVARLIGSPAMEVVGFGLTSLPFLAAAYVRLIRQRVSLRRRLSDARVQPGARVTVTVEVENRSPRPTSFLLIQDKFPASLGRPARLVVCGVQRRVVEHASYTVMPRERGRYRLGPLSVDISDPFALTRQRMDFEVYDDLLVTPEVEDLLGTSDPSFGPSFGAMRARHLFRTGEEYYTMRQYQEGDDLRRIHWPSVARTGEIMIRQDESSRRSNGLVLLDSRATALGQAHAPGFERAVSVCATLGTLLSSRGFGLRLATADTAPIPVSQDRFLDALAAVTHTGTKSIGPALVHLRAGSSADTTLIYVASPPIPTELPSLIRAGAGYGPKLAVLVYPIDPTALPPERQAQMEGRATQARLALSRAGWDCIVLPPSMRLRERWHAPKERQLVHSV